MAVVSCNPKMASTDNDKLLGSAGPTAAVAGLLILHESDCMFGPENEFGTALMTDGFF